MLVKFKLHNLPLNFQKYTTTLNWSRKEHQDRNKAFNSLKAFLNIKTKSTSLQSLEVVKLRFILKLKIKRNEIKRNDWLLASSQSLCFVLSLRLYSSFITSGPGINHLST